GAEYGRRFAESPRYRVQLLLELLGIHRRGEGKVVGVDILTARNRLPVLGEVPRDLVAHDRVRIGVRRSQDRGLLDRCENLLDDLLLAPSLSQTKELDRLLRSEEHTSELQSHSDIV